MENQITSKGKYGLFSIPVLVAALGYLVDIYDLTLFSTLRVPSLKGLGITDKQAISLTGTMILNWQLTGIIIGGLIWGITGDKLGRRIVLFGSILTYSLANIACGFVQDAHTYAVLRFIAGIGIAGELGAAITLISEIIDEKKRSYATSIVTGFGLLGAVLCYYTYQLLDWRLTYTVGGILGFLLLFLRFKIFDSALFEKLKLNSTVQRGNFFAILFDPSKLLKYLYCIGVAIPIYFFFGIIAVFGNEIGEALKLNGEVSPAKCVTWCYVGLALGDLISGPLSQALRSRKTAIFIMLTATLGVSCVTLFGAFSTPSTYYLLCVLGGIAAGYWAMFLITTAESFGTNLRATATTSAPNMVRGALILMTLCYQPLKLTLGIIFSVSLIGVVCFAIAYTSLLFLKETFAKDLDFVE